MSTGSVGLKENRAGFYAGLVGGFAFYVVSMLIAMNWETATTAAASVKAVIELVSAAVVGVLLYLWVYSFANKRLEGIESTHKTRDAILGIVAGLVIAFFFGNLFYNPSGLGPEPLFPLQPLFPLNN